MTAFATAMLKALRTGDDVKITLACLDDKSEQTISWRKYLHQNLFLLDDEKAVLKKYLPRKSVKVLDIDGGIGGRHLKFIRDCFPKAELWGVIEDPTIQTFVRQQSLLIGANIRASLNDVRGKEFDAILLLSGNGGFFSPGTENGTIAGLRKLSNKLKPGGVLFWEIRPPSHGEFESAKYQYGYNGKKDKPFWWSEYTEEWLLRQLPNCGLKHKDTVACHGIHETYICVAVKTKA
jgi:hypothetical protein